MKAETYPLQVLLWALSGWVNRHQQDVIAYLVEENRVLKEQMKGRRLRLTNGQRRRLAAKGKRLGRKTLNRVATSTIAKVLKDNGIKPAPDRPSSWKTFLQAHWGEIAGMDFFTTEVWTPRGLKTYYILFAIDLKSRKVRLG